MVTDAPQYHWALFSERVQDDGQLPTNVQNYTADASTLDGLSDGIPLPPRFLAVHPVNRDMIALNDSDPHDLWPSIFKRSTPN